MKLTTDDGITGWGECYASTVGPEAMRAVIAEDLGISLGQVNVKATTTERLGFTGRGEGIAAEAVVLVEHQEALNA